MGPAHSTEADAGGGKVLALRPGLEPLGDWRDRLLYRLTKDDRREIVSCSANIISILQHDDRWAGVLAWDNFDQGIIATRDPKWDVDDAPNSTEKVWRESHAIRLQAWVARYYTIHVAPKVAYESALVVAEAHSIDPALTWAESLVLDPERRLIDTWLHVYLGAEDTPYTRMVGRHFLTSSMARIYRPGCKVDTMPVLEGDQGLRKSTALRVLFGQEWFSDTPLDMSSKDRFLGLRGLLCHEVAELDSFTRAEVARIKSFLSSAIDDFREPYARRNSKIPRRIVLVGTVNPGGQGYLRDETGNRRFLPVRCAVGRPLDVQALARDRLQLWAEARELWRLFVAKEAAGVAPDDNPGRWWAGHREETVVKDQQAMRLATDPWHGRIALYLSKRGPDAFVKIDDILGDVLAIEAGRWSPSDQARAAACVVKCGWERRQRRIKNWSGQGSNREWGYALVGSSEAP